MSNAMPKQQPVPAGPTVKDGTTAIGKPTRNRTPGVRQGQSAPASSTFALGEGRPD